MTQPTDTSTRATLERYARRKCLTCGGSKVFPWKDNEGIPLKNEYPCESCREYPDGPSTGLLLPMLSEDCSCVGCRAPWEIEGLHEINGEDCQGTGRVLAISADGCDAAAEKAGVDRSLSMFNLPELRRLHPDEQYKHTYGKADSGSRGLGFGPTRQAARKAALVAVLVATWP